MQRIHHQTQSDGADLKNTRGKTDTYQRETLEYTVPVHPLHTLQKKIGNRAVMQLINRHAGNKQREIESQDPEIDVATDEITPSIKALHGKGNPLSRQELGYFEERFGTDLGTVRIHTDSESATLARKLNAQAFAVGNNIVFDQGMYCPETETGRRLLAHELTHTIQQGLNPSVQTKLLISNPDDSFEREADRIADTLQLSNDIPHITPAAPGISRREAASSNRIDDNTCELEMDDGERYRVTRRLFHSSTTSEEFLPPSISFDASLDSVSVRISWCRNTRGNVDLGLRNLDDSVRNIAQTILRGEGLDDALQSADWTPFINFVIARSGRWEISMGVSVTASGQNGVQNITGEVRAESGRFHGGVRGVAERGIPGRPQDEWGGRAEFFGGIDLDGPEQFRCPTEPQFDETFEARYRCEIFRTRTVTRNRRVPRPEHEIRYVYFPYARSTIDMQRSAQELSMLQSHLQEGYRITLIEGFTSPEGLRSRQRKFEGNDSLSVNRAQAAYQWVVDNSAGLLPEGESCFGSSFQQEISVVGQSELHSGYTESGAELHGSDLVNEAERQFLEDDREERHRTEEFMEDLSNARTASERADLLYPLLRRAAVRVDRTVTVNEPYEATESGWEVLGECPQDVLNAARSCLRRPQ